jgi:hypothetical protein
MRFVSVPLRTYKVCWFDVFHDACSGVFTGRLRKWTDLLLNHRFRWLRRGYRVCVSMYNLPDTVFGAKDHRSPQSVWGDILPSANLGLCPLYLHNVGKLRSHVLRYDLDGNHLAISAQRCGMFQGLSNLLPSTHGRAIGVSESYIFSTERIEQASMIVL